MDKIAKHKTGGVRGDNLKRMDSVCNLPGGTCSTGGGRDVAHRDEQLAKFMGKVLGSK